MRQVENFFVTLNNFFAALKELLSLGNEKKSKLSFCISLTYS